MLVGAGKGVEMHVGGGENGACNVVSPWLQFREKNFLWFSP